MGKSKGYGSKILLIVGDVHGHWDLLDAQMRKAAEINGRLDGAFLAGDAEAIRNVTDLEGVAGPAKYRKLGSFPLVMSGEIKLIAPVYFIGGNHEPYPALDKAVSGTWGPGVFYLGRAGAKEVLGIRVAYLSGIYSPRVSELKENQRVSIKEKSYWVRGELEKTKKSNAKGHIDLLITHDWPYGIGEDSRGTTTGDRNLTDLNLTLNPTLHVCGHMHHRISSKLGENRVEALSHIRSGGEASLVLEWSREGISFLPPLPIEGLAREFL